MLLIVCAEDHTDTGQTSKNRGNGMINLCYNGEAWEGYDDEYTVTIYHRSQAESDRTIDILCNYQGWIPVSKRMPEEYLPNRRIGALSDEVLVTVDEEGERYITKGFTRDGKWHVVNGSANVIAWMPFPDPYKGELYEAD